MAENLAQEIREQETLAKAVVADAKAKAAGMMASARAEAEQSLKSTKQQCHRNLRESLAHAEREAEESACTILAQGMDAAEKLYESKKKDVETVADWLVKEVTTAYGSC